MLRAAVGAEFGDIFMRCVYRMRPYEATPGSVDALHREWLAKVQKFVSAKHISIGKFRRMCTEIIRDFDAIPVLDIKKPRRWRDPGEVLSCRQQSSGGAVRE